MRLRALFGRDIVQWLKNFSAPLRDAVDLLHVPHPVEQDGDGAFDLFPAYYAALLDDLAKTVVGRAHPQDE